MLYYFINNNINIYTCLVRKIVSDVKTESVSNWGRKMCSLQYIFVCRVYSQPLTYLQWSFCSLPLNTHTKYV